VPAGPMHKCSGNFNAFMCLAVVSFGVLLHTDLLCPGLRRAPLAGEHILACHSPAVLRHNLQWTQHKHHSVCILDCRSPSWTDVSHQLYEAVVRRRRYRAHKAVPGGTAYLLSASRKGCTSV
jgi:hypothetical protein